MRGRILSGREPERQQLDAELRDHRVRQIDEWVAADMSAEEARHRVLRAFGIPALLGQQSADCGALELA